MHVAAAQGFNFIGDLLFQFFFHTGAFFHHAQKGAVIVGIGKIAKIFQLAVQRRARGMLRRKPGIEAAFHRIDAHAHGLGLFSGFVPDVIQPAEHQQPSSFQSRVDKRAVEVCSVFLNQGRKLLQHRLGKTHFDLAQNFPIPDTAPLGHGTEYLRILRYGCGVAPLLLVQAGLEKLIPGLHGL